MERAARLIEPYTREPWVRGILLVGSASRPFRDRISDYDFEIAVDDDAYALNSRLVTAGAVEALAKLLFLLAGSWPALRHWTSHELRLTGVDDDLLARMAETVERVDPEIVEEAHRRLDDAGFDFHRDLPTFRKWAFLSDEGKRAFAAWGAR